MIGAALCHVDVPFEHRLERDRVLARVPGRGQPRPRSVEAEGSQGRGRGPFKEARPAVDSASLGSPHVKEALALVD